MKWVYILLILTNFVLIITKKVSLNVLQFITLNNKTKIGFSTIMISLSRTFPLHHVVDYYFTFLVMSKRSYARCARASGSRGLLLYKTSLISSLNFKRQSSRSLFFKYFKNLSLRSVSGFVSSHSSNIISLSS
jgi:hypothetical protein